MEYYIFNLSNPRYNFFPKHSKFTPNQTKHANTTYSKTSQPSSPFVKKPLTHHKWSTSIGCTFGLAQSKPNLSIGSGRSRGLSVWRDAASPAPASRRPLPCTANNPQLCHGPSVPWSAWASWEPCTSTSRSTSAACSGAAVFAAVESRSLLWRFEFSVGGIFWTRVCFDVWRFVFVFGGRRRLWTCKFLFWSCGRAAFFGSVVASIWCFWGSCWALSVGRCVGVL